MSARGEVGHVLRIEGAGECRELPLGDQPVTVGRHEANTLVIDDDAASRHHCVIEPVPGGWQIRDLRSRNGTLLNGRPLTRAPFAAGDVAAIGAVRIALRSVAPASSPSPAAPATARVAPALSPSPAAAGEGRGGGMFAPPRVFAPPPAPPAPPAPLRAAPDACELLLFSARGLPVGSDADTTAHGALAAVRSLLAECAGARASDIHLEPKGDHYAVRLRVDGVLVEAGHAYPEVGDRMCRAIKVLCDIDIAVPGVSQEGHFSALLGTRKIDYRASFIPSNRGQKLVLRALDPEQAPGRLDSLHLPTPMHDALTRLLAQDQGMLLVCGPTGSGKTTTIYASLRSIDADRRNLVTIEDPIEYQLDGITQFPVDAAKGSTMLTLLRSILRQDPDVVFIGEIRDADTARTAMQAAMTGHLVLSTAHVQDTLGAVFRLMDLGIEPYLLGSGLNLVLAQRLVRLLCPACRRPRAPTPEEAGRVAACGRSLTWLFVPAGCPLCRNTGYAGRRGIFELLTVGDALRSAIMSGPTYDTLRHAAATTPFARLREGGYDLVIQGLTSLEEVEQVLGSL
ncbi:MAG: Flp pilus assembly complex ATPase component TadA [Planctomycetes bacterium]|nr:Flp pilus assembly complex ATPase component TadA [Planctomycetota bacterium]